MLKRSHRLPSYIRLHSATVTRFPFFTVRYQSSDAELSRVGVVISKKVSPKAVERNRIKRLIHTCLLTSLPAWKVTHDMLIIVHPGAASLTNEVFSQRVAEYFSKLSI